MDALLRHTILTYYIDELRVLQAQSMMARIIVQELRATLCMVVETLRQPDLDLVKTLQCKQLLDATVVEANIAQARSDALSNQVQVLIAAQALQEVFGYELSNSTN